MTAVSYQIAVGGNLENVTIGAADATGGSGFVELRINTNAAITDTTSAVSPRPIKRGEVAALLRILEQALIRDTSLNQ